MRRIFWGGTGGSSARVAVILRGEQLNDADCSNTPSAGSGRPRLLAEYSAWGLSSIIDYFRIASQRVHGYFLRMMRWFMRYDVAGFFWIIGKQRHFNDTRFPSLFPIVARVGLGYS